MRETNYDLAGRMVLVMGLGRFGGGVDVVRFAAGRGARVVVTDLADRDQLCDSVAQIVSLPDVELHLGGHDPEDFGQADVVVANPAVSADNKFLRLAHSRNRFVTSRMNIFFELCPASIIGITGANGKSTTTALTAHLLRSSRGKRYEKVWLGGNIGNEPLLTVVDQIKPDDLVVLELSSFQLEQLARIEKAPKVAVLTNLTPNHLDRYGTFESYCAAKENIFRFQPLDRDCPAVSIFNGSDEIAAEWFDKYKDAGRVCIKFSADDVSEEIRGCFTLPGRANLSNLAAASAVAGHFGVGRGEMSVALPQFKALPHRLEFVAEMNGIRWYNDSKATTPESAIAALDAFEQPAIVIAGGYDKRVSLAAFGEKIANKAKAAILLGQTAGKIAGAVMSSPRPGAGPRIETVGSLAEAVHLAGQMAVAGDLVLLSPACASYDMFENFEQRGEQFCRLVWAISS